MSDLEADEVLLPRVAGGDERAFTVLVGRYEKRFFGVGVRILGNERDAEDAVQIAFLRIFRTATSYEPTGSARTWLYRVVTNVCLDQWRKRSRERFAASSGADDTAAPGEGVSAAVRMDVRHALSSLSPEARAVVVLRFSEDLPYQEIARIRGVSVNTIKTQLARAKRALRAALEGAE